MIKPRLAALAVLPLILLAGCSEEDVPKLPEIPDVPNVDVKSAWTAAIDAAGIDSAVDSTEALYERATKVCDEAKSREDVASWAETELKDVPGAAADALTQATWSLIC